MKIDKAIYNYIEYELEKYNDNNKLLQELKDEIIHKTKKIKLKSSISIIRLEKIINTIKNVMNRLDHTYQLFIEYKYIKKWGIVKICNELHISERTYYRIKDRIIENIAKELGY